MQPKKQRFHLPANVKLGLVLFGLVSGFMLAALPRLFHSGAPANSGTMPPMPLFIVAGLAMIGLTALLFAYFGRTGMGLGRTALVCALGYNVAIVVVKFFLAPLALYSSNRTSSFSAEIFDPNSIEYYWLIGGIVLALYLLVFGMMHRHYRRRVAVYLDGAPKKKILVSLRTTSLVVVLVIVVAIVSRGALLIPLLVAAPGLQYITYLIGVFALPVLVAIIVAIVLAQRGFRAAAEQSIQLRNPALLASFFWVGLSMIMLYHFLWMIFMVTLVQLWPFNTYTPK